MPTDTPTIRQLVADLSRHGAAAQEILALGVAAVPALASCLDDPPRSVPHARRFAVSMLAAIAGPEATAALRRVLHRHDLQALPPHLAEPERLVQNDAFVALAARFGSGIRPEIGYGLSIARLPAAAEAVGQFAFAEWIDALIDMLADDVMGQPAHQALAQFGRTAAPALLAVLHEPVDGVTALRRRLAAVDLVGRLPAATGRAALIDLLHDEHPAVSAAAALALSGSCVSAEALAASLARGALLPDAVLAAHCLAALPALPAPALLVAARAALATEYLPDLYGTFRPVGIGHRARLAASVLRRADIDATPVIAELPHRVLLAAVRAAGQLGNDTTVATLQRHPHKRIRESADALVRKNAS